MENINRIIIYRILFCLLAIESIKYLVTIDSIRIFIINKLHLDKNEKESYKNKHNKKKSIILTLINFFIVSGRLFFIIFSIVVCKFLFTNDVKKISLYDNSFKNIMSYISSDFKLSECKKNTNILNQVWLTPEYLYKEYQELYSSLLYLKASNYQIIEKCIKKKYKLLNSYKKSDNIADYTFYKLSLEDFKTYLVNLQDIGISTIYNPTNKIIKDEKKDNVVVSYSLNVEFYNLNILINSINEIVKFDMDNFITLKFPPQNTSPYTNDSEKNKVYACILFIFLLHSYVVPLNIKEYTDFILLQS